MKICHQVLTKIEMAVWATFFIIREIVRTICGWVTSTLTVLEEVCEWIHERVCSWLPWPLNELCNWVSRQVCRLIEVVKTITEWVCQTIVETIFEAIRVFLVYVFYILHWVCWFVEWVTTRWWTYLICLAGLNPTVYLPVCLKILADSEGNQTMTITDAIASITAANAVVAQCNIVFVIRDIQVIVVPDDSYLTDVDCGTGGMFTGYFSFFSSNALGECLTIYYVERYANPNTVGCQYPGANWITVQATASNIGWDISHETGHASDLWQHSDDSANLMSANIGTGIPNITPHQCCILRSSRFTQLHPRGVGLLDTTRAVRFVRP